MREVFCKSCHAVFSAAKPECCGEVVDFDPCNHGRWMVRAANSWRCVWNEWEDHPLVKQVEKEHAERGNCSAPAILNDAIAKAFEQEQRIEELESRLETQGQLVEQIGNALELETKGRHYHKASKNDICAACGEDLRSPVHFRVGEHTRNNKVRSDALTAYREWKEEQDGHKG